MKCLLVTCSALFQNHLRMYGLFLKVNIAQTWEHYFSLSVCQTKTCFWPQSCQTGLVKAQYTATAQYTAAATSCGLRSLTPIPVTKHSCGKSHYRIGNADNSSGNLNGEARKSFNIFTIDFSLSKSGLGHMECFITQVYLCKHTLSTAIIQAPQEIRTSPVVSSL